MFLMKVERFRDRHIYDHFVILLVEDVKKKYEGPLPFFKMEL